MYGFGNASVLERPYIAFAWHCRRRHCYRVAGGSGWRLGILCRRKVFFLVWFWRSSTKMPLLEHFELCYNEAHCVVDRPHEQCQLLLQQDSFAAAVGEFYCEVVVFGRVREAPQAFLVDVGYGCFLPCAVAPFSLRR